MNSEDGDGLKLEKLAKFFSSSQVIFLKKSQQNYSGLLSLINLIGALCG